MMFDTPVWELICVWPIGHTHIGVLFRKMFTQTLTVFWQINNGLQVAQELWRGPFMSTPFYCAVSKTSLNTHVSNVSGKSECWQPSRVILLNII